MRKLALLLGALALPACCVSNHVAVVPHPPSEANFINKLEHETVALTHYVDENGSEVKATAVDHNKDVLLPYCAGVWVARNYILTAEHCVDDIGRPEMVDADADDDSPSSKLKRDVEAQLGGVKKKWTPQGQPVIYSTRDDITDTYQGEHDARVAEVDMRNDLALLAVKDPAEHPIAPITEGTIADGQQLHLVGHEGYLWWTYRHGYVASHRARLFDDGPNEPPHDMLQVSAPIAPGDSGGPAFDMNGHLIGIADSISRVLPNVAFYVHRDVVRAFLMKHEIIRDPTR